MTAFQRHLRSVTGDEPPPQDSWEAYRPWWVKKFESGECKWLVLEVHPLVENPGVSGARVHAFDAQWHRIAKQEFPTGYRFDVADAAIDRANPLGENLLVITIEYSGPFVGRREDKRPAFEASYREREFFAWRHDHVVLVRLEDGDGKIIPNPYDWAQSYKGPPVPDRTADQWISALSSADGAEQLGALVWLTGGHFDSSNSRSPGTSQESLEHAKAFEGARDSAETRKLVPHLRVSPNEWMRDYAWRIPAAEAH
jgi:hypothetical protein